MFRISGFFAFIGALRKLNYDPKNYIFNSLFLDSGGIRLLFVSLLTILRC